MDAQLKCQGLSAWLSLLASAVPLEYVTEPSPEDVSDNYVQALESAYAAPIFTPPVPPPRGLS
ncbi:MAG: hypothetical protein AB7O38_04945 [Pirellulaceae bacterium]